MAKSQVGSIGAIDGQRTAVAVNPSLFPWIGPVCAAAFLPAAPLVSSLSVAEQLLLSVPLIVLAGIPHGGTDLPLGRYVFTRRFGRNGLPVFLGAYILVSLLTFGLWVLSSSLALLLFLGLAVWHFGREDCEAHGLPNSIVWALLFGLSPFAGAFVFWMPDVGQIFSWLAIDGRPLLWGSMDLAPAVIGGAWIVALMGVLLFQVTAIPRAQTVRAALDLAVTLALFIFIPPLLAFAIYFTVVHSPRHIWSVYRWTRTQPGLIDGQFHLQVLIAWGLVVAIGAGIAALWIARSEAHALEPSVILPVLFIGLSVLTVPHMLFNGWADALLTRATRQNTRTC